MCGIGGVVDNAESRVEPDDLRSLAAALAHRGPDGEGVWVSHGGNIGLVHRRLAILDTSERARSRCTVRCAALRCRTSKLTTTKAWDWHTFGRLWPYIHLKWYIDG